MKLIRICVCALLGAAFAVLSFAQQASPGYHAVACFKLKPDSAPAFQKWTADEMHKVAQGRIDDGEITAFYLLRSVFPRGEAADCDYLIVTFFPNMPHEFGPERVDAAIKKAGLKFTGEDYFKHRDALVHLMSVGIFQNLAFVGTSKKGDYFQVNYMKVANENFDDWIAFEKKVWQPFAEAMVKDGREEGWSVNVAAMPFGSDRPYQGVTVDVFPSLDAAFAEDKQFGDRFKKVHPDMELGTTFEKAQKLRAQAEVELYELEEFVAAAH
ncbi:MAG: hypothetical protein ACLPH3_17270 [Terracidiphilus sp.]